MIRVYHVLLTTNFLTLILPVIILSYIVFKIIIFLYKLLLLIIDCIINCSSPTDKNKCHLSIIMVK